MEFDVLIFGVLTMGAVLIVNQLARIVRTGMLHKTIRRAIGSDSVAVQALLQGIEEQPAPNTDDRTGLVLVALAIAVFLFGVIQGDADDIRNMAGIALFPLFVGLALLGRFILAKRSGRS